MPTLGEICSAAIFAERDRLWADGGQRLTPAIVTAIIDAEDTKRMNVPTVAPKKKAKKPGANIPPSPAEVDTYCALRGYLFAGQEFCDFYESKGWVVGKARMKNWQAACRTWAKRDGRSAKPKAGENYQKF